MSLMAGRLGYMQSINTLVLTVCKAAICFVEYESTGLSSENTLQGMWIWYDRQQIQRLRFIVYILHGPLVEQPVH